MKISIELEGLEETRALLEENKQLVKALRDNINRIECACLSIREKEDQPEAGTNG